MSSINVAMLEQWDDVTTLGVPVPAPDAGSRRKPQSFTSTPEEESQPSGTHRIARVDALTSEPEYIELDAPLVLGRDQLCSIITAYVASVNHAQAALHIQDTLEHLGLSGRPVPQPLAGHLVLSLANRIEAPTRRSDFLAHAWALLGGPSSTRMAPPRAR